MTTNQRELPQELVDCIIDHLHDDRSTLKACALVSKSWILSSYAHIFRLIHIVGIDRLQAFAIVLQLSPIFASFVRKLRYSEGPPFEPRTDPAAGTWGSTLHDVLRCLPNTRSLVLQGVEISHHFNCSSVPTRKYTLESLSIYNCIATSFDLECILRAFEEIGSLSVLNTSSLLKVSTSQDDVPTSPPEPTSNELTRVRSIWMRYTWQESRKSIHSILTALKKQIVSDSVRAVDLLLEPNSIDVIEAFLDGLLPNLHDLRLDYRSTALSIHDPAVTQCTQWFTRCRQLKSLTLYLILNSEYIEDLRCHWANILEILTSLSRNCHDTLRSFKIIWHIYGQEVKNQVLGPNDWDMLSESLGSFQILERVDFVWEMNADDWEWLKQNTPLNPDPFTIDCFVWETGPDTIRQLLPKLHSQGLLHFDTTGPESPP